ncbi:MAG: tetratricopeptide repeat protein [Lachnospiraceae bacterium]|nr:tetratricopeptide repeat protein [Lachnospiraceae bacterium]
MDYIASSGRLLKEKRPTQALLVCTEGIAEDHEEQAALLVNQGVAFARLGKIEQALDSFGKALENDPNDEDAMYNKHLLQQVMEQNASLEEDTDLKIKGV